MADRSFKKTSKFLSLILRHQPEVVGLALDEQGWANIDELLAAANHNGHQITREFLLQVVAENDKQRFIVSDDKTKIRANQGHSIDIDLKLEPVQPPETLFHGTVQRFLAAIEKEGLKSGSRQHVHLSTDVETAKSVGGRRGAPVILTIQSAQMQSDGFHFFLSNNGVWLTDHVPAKYLKKMSETLSENGC